MLHMVNKSAPRSNSLEAALRIASPSDPILLIEDGVQACRSGAAGESAVKKALESRPVYALKPDLDARGVSRIIDGIKIIGYDDFVDLTEEHQVVTWT